MDKINENQCDNQIESIDDFNDYLIEPKEVLIDKISIEDLCLKAKFKMNGNYLQPETILEINGKIWGTAGNFSVISGKAKSKKTFLLTLLVPALLTQENYFGAVKGKSYSNKKRVILFDTEQSPYHLFQEVSKIMKMGSLNAETINSFLPVFNLRSFKVDERIEIVEYTILHEPNLGTVIIDGIRDLMHDINNMQEATNIIDKLLFWTENRGIHIIVILHENKTNNQLRGHIGSELMNKCETMVSLTEFADDKSISIVEFPVTRNLSPDPFAIQITEEGLIKVIDLPAIKEKVKKSTGPSVHDLKEFTKALDYIFTDNEPINQTSFRQGLGLFFNVGDSKAREYVKYCENDLKIVEVSKGSRNSNKYQRISSS